MPAARGTPQRIQSLKLDGAGLRLPDRRPRADDRRDRAGHRVRVRPVVPAGVEAQSRIAVARRAAAVRRHQPARHHRHAGLRRGTTNHVFVVAELGGSVRHELFALDATTGRVAWRKSVDLPGVSARDMQQRGALAIADNRVWVSFGAQAGDCGDYKGRVVGVPLDGGSDVIFYSPPTERGGGIWNPAGPTVNAAGHLLVVSANGAAFPGDAYDHTNSVLELDANAKAGRLVRTHRLGCEQPGRCRPRLAGGGPGRHEVGGARRQIRPGVRAAPRRPGRHRRPGRRAEHLPLIRRGGGRRRCRLPALHGRRPRGPGRRLRPPARAVARVRLDHRVAGHRRRAHLGPRHRRGRAARPRPGHRPQRSARSASASPTGSRHPRSTARTSSCRLSRASPSCAPPSAHGPAGIAPRRPRESWSCGPEASFL